MKEEKVARPDVLSYEQGRQAERMTEQIKKPPVLSEEQIEAIVHRAFPLFELNEQDEEGRKETTLSLLETQRDAGAAYYEPLIQQAKAKVAREIEPLIDKLFEALDHADFSNGIEAHGIDEGRVRANEHIGQLRKEWQSLKSKYMEEK